MQLKLNTFRWLALSALVAAPLFLGMPSARADDDGLKEKKIDLTTVVHGKVTEDQVTEIDNALIKSFEDEGWTVIESKDEEHAVDMTISITLDDDGEGYSIAASWDQDAEPEATEEVADEAGDDAATDAIVVIFLKDAGDGDLGND